LIVPHELNKDEYEKALPLLVGEPLTYFHIVLKAIAEGNTSGRLWVDNPATPNTLLMWDEGPILGLAGDTSNSRFNEDLATLVSRQIAPALAHGHHGFKMFYTNGWEEGAAHIFKNAQVQKRDRVISIFDTLKVEHWKDNIPAGCSVRQINLELLASESLENLDTLKEEIACCWTSVAHFLDKGLGFCVVTGGKIASWCTAEYASGTDRGIGIETVEEYQGRGFATLTACAFVEHCLSKGLTPYWDAWKSNIPSLALADKVGFKKIRDYPVILGRFAAT
jgi:GNAT superfamily N-acetyltransferase